MIRNLKLSRARYELRREEAVEASEVALGPVPDMLRGGAGFEKSP